MKVFNAYAKYYDLLYRDKDYFKESDYIFKLIKKFKPDAKSVLDLGCGTGRHDLYLSRKGLNVTGVEISETMFKAAEKTLSEDSNQKENLKLKFLKGDIRNIRLNKKYDVIVSLFHVMNYQSTNNDLLSVFETAKKHLKKDGVFIFDFWYGPAVLSDRPVKKVKIMEDRQFSVKRYTVPEIRFNDNIAEISFRILVKEKKTGKIQEHKELHIMRYLFLPEIGIIANIVKMKIRHTEEWISGKKLTNKSWYGLIVIENNGGTNNI